MLSLSPDVIALMATWTATVALFAWWLSAQFRSLEKLIYRLINEHEEQNRADIQSIKDRVMVLELKAFGYTPVVPMEGVHPLPTYRRD